MEENNNNKNNSKINRRDFFKLAGAGTFASAAALYGCSDKNNRSDSESAALGEIPTDKMVYRTNPTTGDRVSLLGYGCMRWPTRKRADGNGDEIDQEAVNELIDYAIAHDVNYFDTSPVYVQGWSEKSTGIALKRHPREKFLIATKLSNFSNYTRENSIAMYRKSFEDLQVDYIDYYLLHSVGNGGIKTFRARYIDNGMIDFLMEERKAGRIRNLGFSFHGTTEVFDEILAMHDRIHWDFVQIQLNYADWRHASGGKEPHEALEEIASQCSIAIVKIGKEGSLIRKGTQCLQAAPVTVTNVVDTTGAGDFYAAGFLYGLTNGYSLEKCARIATILSSHVTNLGWVP